MAKEKQIEKEKNESLFHKSVEQRYGNGDFKSSVSVDLSPWEFNEKKGFSLRIRSSKNGKPSFVSIDATDGEVKHAIFEAYEKLDSLNC